MEDDSSNQELLCINLRNAGHEVEIEKDGYKALKRPEWDSNPFDIVITSIEMYGLVNGYNLTSMLNKSHPKCRIVIVTGHQKGDVEANLAKWQCKATVLEKPFTQSDLLAAVDSAGA